MKSIVCFYFLFFCFKNDIEAVTLENFNLSTIIQTNTSQVNYFVNLTNPNVLHSGIDENDKIEQKLIQVLTEFTSDSKSYSPIKLMSDASFPQNPIRIDLGSGHKAVLDNLIIVHSNSGPEKRRYTTTVDCTSSGNTTISFVLPHDLRIAGLLKVIHASTNSLIEGEIDVTFEGTRFYKTLSTTNAVSGSNLGGDSGIAYQNAAMHINVEKEVQTVINRKWNNIMRELETSIKETFEQDLNTQLSIRNSSVKNHSLVLFCSNKINDEQNNKNVSVSLHNNLNFNKKPLYYVIPEKTIRVWKGAILSTGPIIIEGLTNFSNLKLKITEDEHAGNNNQIMKDLTTNVITGKLKGKFEWGYFVDQVMQNRTFVNLFSVDFLQLENAVEYLTYRECNQITLEVSLGEITLNDSEDLRGNKNFMLNSFLSVHLSKVIKAHLKNTITQKLNSDLSFSSCPGVNQER